MNDRATSFAEHAREQRLRWLALTPEERLAWLERAKRFERAARAATQSSGEQPASGAKKDDAAR